MSSTEVGGVNVVGCSVGSGVVGVVGDVNGADVGRGAATLVLWSESEDFAHAKPASTGNDEARDDPREDGPVAVR